MAITNAIMQMRRGLEADFDPDKMRPGEWAVSLDKKYVRMCFFPGVCVRMATYDAFEKDMAAIQDILAECQTIEQAVTLINTQISANAQAVAEYTAQAKQYRDEAKQFRDEAETSATNAKTSEDKAKVSETNAKISEENARRVAESLPEDYTDLSKAFYNTAIKQKAVGDNIHVTDSADSKIVEFGLYGKAEQKQYSGKNLLKNTAESKTENGVTFTVNEDKSVTANGTVSGTTSGRVYFNINLKFKFTKAGTYILNGCPSGGSSSTWRLLAGIKYSDGTYFKDYIECGSGVQFEVTQEMIDSSMYAMVIAYIYEGVSANNITFYPMLRLASITDDTYEPYVGGIASPNPDYPQEITVSGSDGSVGVVSCGKNLLDNTATTQTINGVTFTVNADKSVTVNGTSTSAINYSVNSGFVLPKGKYMLSQGGILSNSGLYIANINGASDWFFASVNGKEFEVTTPNIINCAFYIPSGVTANNVVIYPMIRPAFDTDSTYEPYRAVPTVSTIPTPDGLCGIKVASDGNYTDENGQQWICDEIVKYADGSGKRVQRIGKAVFDGSEDEGWKNASTNVTDKVRKYISGLSEVIKKPSSNYDIFNGISNTFKAVPASGTDSTYHCNIGVSFGIDGNLLVYSDSYNTSDVSLWTAYLAENPMTLYYELAEPIITDLTAEEIAEIEKLHTFYPITNISNDADCGMSITYLADSKNYIDGQLAIQKAQQEAALLNMLLLLPEETQAAMIENDTNNLLNESEV